MSDTLKDVLAKVREAKKKNSTLTDEQRKSLAKDIANYADKCQMLGIETLNRGLKQDDDNTDYASMIVMLAAFITPTEMLFDTTGAIDRTVKNILGIAAKEGWFN